MQDEKCDGYKELELLGVLSQFKHVLDEKPGQTNIVKMNIRLEEGTKVISQSPYRIPDRLKAGVKSEIDSFIAGNIIEPSDSPWCSPCVPVVKLDGKVRHCVDYRHLNK